MSTLGFPVLNPYDLNTVNEALTSTRFRLFETNMQFTLTC